MTRNVVIVYDDSRRPGKDIAGITGNKSFGQTIYKRHTLRERVEAAFREIPQVAGFFDAGSREIGLIKNTPVILYYSDFGIAKIKDLETIVYKAGYAHENYKITHKNRIACVIFKDVNAFLSASGADLELYTEIISDAFTDLSDVGNFRSFITEGARTANLDTVRLTDCAVAFCETIRRAGYTPCVYYNRTTGYYRYDLSRLTNYTVWFALPCSPPDIIHPSFYYKLDIWQYSLTGQVPGISVDTDLDYIFTKIPEPNFEVK